LARVLPGEVDVVVVVATVFGEIELVEVVDVSFGSDAAVVFVPPRDPGSAAIVPRERSPEGLWEE